MSRHVLVWETATTWGLPVAAEGQPPSREALEPPPPDADVVMFGQHQWEPYAGGAVAGEDGIMRWTAWRRPRLVVLDPQLSIDGLQSGVYAAAGEG